MTDPHPSYLQLDRIALGAVARDWELHVKTCARCARYLQRQQQPISVPAWVHKIPNDEPALPRRQRLFLFAMAAAAALVVAVVTPRVLAPSATSEKGTPAIAVYVKRGDAVSLWDGRTPLASNDRLQLEVKPEGLRHLAVALRPVSGPWQLLYRSEVAGNETRVPESWRLDEEPGPETLGIALSSEPISDSQLMPILERQVRERGIWTTLLVLPKTTAEKKQ